MSLSPRERRRWAQSLDDADLVAAMRAEDAVAFAEFEHRFRPLLEQFARFAGIPREVSTCVDEVLEDEMLRLATRGVTPPERLAGYLVQAVRHRYYKLRRGATRRLRRYDLAAETGAHGHGEPVVRSLLSAAALRESEGPDEVENGAPRETPGAIAMLARRIDAALDDDERRLLV